MPLRRCLPSRARPQLLHLLVALAAAGPATPMAVWAQLKPGQPLKPISGFVQIRPGQELRPVTVIAPVTVISPGRPGLDAHLGAAEASLLRRHVDPVSLGHLERGLAGANPALVGQLRSALKVLVDAQQQVVTSPMAAAIRQQVASLGQVAASLVGARVQPLSAAVRGSERGPLTAWTAESRGTGLALVEGKTMRSVQVTLAGRTNRIRVSAAGVTRTLDEAGTQEVTETVLPDRRVVWTRTEYTMNGDKPARVRRWKSFVSASGDDLKTTLTTTVQEGSSAPVNSIHELTRMLVEDRVIR